MLSGLPLVETEGTTSSYLKATKDAKLFQIAWVFFLKLAKGNALHQRWLGELDGQELRVYFGP